MTKNIFLKILSRMKFVQKYGTAGHATDEQYNTAHAYCLLDT